MRAWEPDWEDNWDQSMDNRPGEIGDSIKLERLITGGEILRPGDHVRLKPKSGADAFDIILAGRTATIEAIEQDYENRIYLAVTVDDDPGKDFGMLRQPGHRFFYAPDEVELLHPGEDRP